MKRLVGGGQGRSDEEQYDLACVLYRLAVVIFLVVCWCLIGWFLFGWPSW